MSTTDTRAHSIGSGSHMRPGDAFFWYAEAASPRLRPLVAGLFMLDRRPDPGAFRASMERLLAHVPRLRQRVVESALPFILPRWEADPDFDINYHVRRVDLPAPGNTRALLDFTGACFATPLDHLRPLWEAYLIEGVEGRRAALFLKVHHAVMDGVGSVALFGSLTQERRTERVTTPRAPTRSAPPREPVTSEVRAAAAIAAASARALLRGIATAVSDPQGTVDSARWAARGVRGLVSDLMVTPVPDPLVDRCTGIGRRLEVVVLALPRLQRIKRALGGTLNDFVLAIVCGAVRGYYEQRHLPLNDLRCQVPVSLRQDHERLALGNRIGAITVVLPLRESKPLARLERIREQTVQAKQRRDAHTYGWAMRVATMIPAATLRFAAENARGRVHLICSNVPGPPLVRYLAGAKIDAVYPFAPILLGLPLSVALMSYGKMLCIGLDTDPASIPDPERLGRLIEREVERFERRALPRRKRLVQTKTREKHRRTATNGQRVNGHLRDATVLHS